MSFSSTQLGSLKVWTHPAEKAKGTIVICHGLSEHSGRYESIVQCFNELHLNCVRFDLRGCGQSLGKRQWIKSFQDYVDDLSQVFKWTQAQFKGPYGLFGHSLGGAISTYFAQQNPQILKFLILSAPAYRVGDTINPWVIRLGQVLNTLFPTFRLPKPKDTGQICSIPEEIDKYNQDPLRDRFNTLNQGAQILLALKEMPSKIASISQPLLILHGVKDRIILIEGSFELIRQSSSMQRELFVMPYAKHESFRDIGKEEFFLKMRNWLTTLAL